MVGRTRDGFEVEIDERLLNDWRFTMAVVELQTGEDIEKVSAAGKMVNLLLGDKKEALFAHIAAKNDGIVPAPEVMIAVTELIESCKELKN